MRRTVCNPLDLEYRYQHMSENGEKRLALENVSCECSNGYYEYERGVEARCARVTGGKQPYKQALRISACASSAKARA